jgi:hypothetical protein
MHSNELFRPSVGADVSRTPPIHRPSYASTEAMKTPVGSSRRDKAVMLSRSEASRLPARQTLRYGSG